MSTSGVIQINWGSRALLVLEIHGDGYPDYVLPKLKAFLRDKQIGRGIPLKPPPRFANGVRQLAAQFVIEFQELVGKHNLYLQPLDARNCDGDYNYVLNFPTDYVIGEALELVKISVNGIPTDMGRV